MWRRARRLARWLVCRSYVVHVAEKSVTHIFSRPHQRGTTIFIYSTSTSTHTTHMSSLLYRWVSGNFTNTYHHHRTSGGGALSLFFSLPTLLLRTICFDARARRDAILVVVTPNIGTTGTNTTLSSHIVAVGVSVAQCLLPSRKVNTRARNGVGVDEQFGRNIRN